MKNRDGILFELRHVSYTYTAVHTPSYVALRDVSFDIRHGEFVSIIGPSGSGKSTLMHLLGLMADPSAGHLSLSGKDVSQLTANQKSQLRNTGIGFLFQQFFLIPQLTVLENICLPAEYGSHLLLSKTESFVARQTADSSATERALQLIARFGLEGHKDKRPSQLSGGQRQRVALCRALMMDPDVLMCDEPTGALDSQTAQDVLKILEELHADGRTIIVITHDPEVASRAQRILRIVDGAIVSDSQRPIQGSTVSVSAERLKPSPAPTPASAQRQFLIIIKSQSTRAIHALTQIAKSMFFPTWEALKTQRLRTALTMIGLLIGVSSIFIMLTLTRSVSHIFEEFFFTQGARKAYVTFDYRQAEKISAPRWRGLNVRTDLPRLNELIKSHGRVDAEIESSGCKITSLYSNTTSTLEGVSSLLDARERNLRVVEGRLPQPQEFEFGFPARIALLGSDAALTLFPRSTIRSGKYPPLGMAKPDNINNLTHFAGSPIGQHIVVRDCNFDGILTVVGVLAPIDSLFDRNINSSIYTPSQTLVAGGVSIYRNRFTTTPAEGVSPTWFAKHVIGKLSLMTQNKFPFRFFAAEQELAKFNLMMGILSGLTIVIGGLCTLIGGIGVMNIMLVNVHERVQEIGIRRAVGARNSDIRWQFLLESMGLCLISGCLGLILGIGVSIAAFKIARGYLPQIENLTYQFDSLAVVVALGVSVSAGLLFGTWPARRAAALNIVDALKQE
jgi:macrolide transport system ATP-binding/permease protein